MSDAEPSLATIEARTHGRYLVRPPRTPGPWPLLVGFHGYAEAASDHMEALQTIPGADQWLLVSVQALHPFYTRKDRVVASWMTRDDRELAIGDNVDYVGRVLARVRADYPASPTLVFSGFSQGGAMAYRAAVNYPANGLIVLAADVPPDIVERRGAVPLPAMLLGRGTRDDWYTEEKLAGDRAALARLDARVEVCVFDGGHEWTDAFRAAAAAFLHRVSQEKHGRS
ncbi:MAG: phospholipase [Acidobacteria bacterium]|nr:MAG: phospholipase [Acidobacteriota bacterium]PYR82075.1 MAG: phospholipase [Acidobacteriota bacterium]